MECIMLVRNFSLSLSNV